MLNEVGESLIEAISMVRLIRYLKIIVQMEDKKWPKVVSMTYLKKRRRLGCDKILNGLVNEIFA